MLMVVITLIRRSDLIFTVFTAGVVLVPSLGYLTAGLIYTRVAISQVCWGLFISGGAGLVSPSGAGVDIYQGCWVDIYQGCWG